MWQDQDLFPAAAYEDRWWKRSISAAKLSSGGGIAIYFLLFLVARRLSRSIFCRPPHTGTSAIYWVFSLFIYLGYYFPTIIILATYRYVGKFVKTLPCFCDKSNKHIFFSLLTKLKYNKIKQMKQLFISTNGFKMLVQNSFIFQLALSRYTFRSLQSAQGEFEIGNRFDKNLNR